MMLRKKNADRVRVRKLKRLRIKRGAPMLSLAVATVPAISWLALPSIVAADDFWTAGTNANWTTAGDWSTGLPGSSDTARITSTTQSEIVTLNTNVTINALAVGSTGSGLATLNESSNLSSVDESVGGDGGGYGRHNQSAGTNTITSYLIVGQIANTNGEYDVSNTATVNLPGTGSYGIGLYVGDAGTGVFNQSGGFVNVGSTTTSNLYLGYSAGAVGTYNLTAGNLGVSGNAFVGGNDAGRGGAGVLNISGTGTATFNGQLVLWNTNNSAVNLGTGGTLTVGSIDTGDGSSAKFSWTGGTVHLTGGATDISTLTVPYGGTLTGLGQIYGNLTNHGLLAPLSSSSGATLNVSSGNVILGPDGTLGIRLGGTTQASQYDYLQGSGTIDVNGTLTFSTVNGFVPVANESFQIFKFPSGSIVGHFTSIQSFNGLSWDTSQLDTTGTITTQSSSNHIVELATGTPPAGAPPNGYESAPLGTLTASNLSGIPSYLNNYGGATTGFTAISGFNTSDPQIFALQVTIDGFALAQNDTRIGVIIGDIKSNEGSGIQGCSTVLGSSYGSLFPGPSGPQILITTTGGARPYFAFDFSSSGGDVTDPDPSLGPVTLLSIADVDPNAAGFATGTGAYWDKPGGGDWNQSSGTNGSTQWSNYYAPPKSSTPTWFGLGSTAAYIVTITTAATCSDLVANNDNVTLNVSGGQTLAVTGSMYIGGVGPYRGPAASAQLVLAGSGNVTVAGALTVYSGSTVSVANTGTFSAGSVNISGGTLNLNGTSTGISGNASVNGGAINLSGGVLVINGTFNLAGGTLNVKGGTVSAGSFNMDSSSALDLVYGNVLAIGSSSSTTFAGTLNLTGTPATSLPENLITYGSFSGSTFNTVTGVPTNDRLLYTANAIELVASGPTTISSNLAGGNWTTPSTWVNGIVPNNSGGTLYNANISGSGINSTLITLGSSVAIVGLNVSNATLNINSASGALAVSGVTTLTSTAAVNVNGIFNVAGGTLADAGAFTVASTGTLLASGVVGGTNNYSIYGGLTLNNDLMLNNNASNFALYSKAITNLAGHVLQLNGSNGALISSGTFNVSGGTVSIGSGNEELSNYGTLNGPGTITAHLNNYGTINTTGLSLGQVINNGSITLGGSYNMSGAYFNYGTTVIGGAPTWATGSSFYNSNGSSTFNVDTGSNTSSPLNVIVSSGSVLFASTEHLAGLSTNPSTTVQVTGGGSGHRSMLFTPSLSDSGTIDLTGNDLDLQNGGTAGLSTIATLIKQGYNKGAWNGTGIVSSTAAGNTTHLTALSVILEPTAMTVDGIAVAANDVIVKYTFYGDANLDGVVDGSDYSRIDNGTLSHGTLTGWNNGDFNYDGTINGSDYTLIDNVFNTQGARLAASLADPPASPTAQIVAGNGAASVPEPASLPLLSLATTIILSRRKNKQ